MAQGALRRAKRTHARPGFQRTPLLITQREVKLPRIIHLLGQRPVESDELEEDTIRVADKRHLVHILSNDLLVRVYGQPNTPIEQGLAPCIEQLQVSAQPSGRSRGGGHVEGKVVEASCGDVSRARKVAGSGRGRKGGWDLDEFKAMSGAAFLANLQPDSPGRPCSKSPDFFPAKERVKSHRTRNVVHFDRGMVRLWRIRPEFVRLSHLPS